MPEWETVDPQSSHLSFLEIFVYYLSLFYWRKGDKKSSTAQRILYHPFLNLSSANLANLLVTKYFFNIWCLVSFCGTTSLENISSCPIYTIWLDYKCNQNALLSTFTALLAFQFCNRAKEVTHTQAHAAYTPFLLSFSSAPCECPNTFLFSES